MKTSLAFALLLFSLGVVSSAFAAAAAPEKPAAPAEAKPAEKKDEKEKVPLLSVTEHRVTIGGKVIRYQAAAGYMAM